MPTAYRCSLAAAALALGACSSGGRSAPAAPPRPTSREAGARELTADEQVRQALDRLTFGARPGDAARVRAMGVDRWIAMQLDPARIDDGATDAFVSRYFPTVTRSPAELVRDDPPPQLLLAAMRRAQRRDPGAGSGAPALVLSSGDSAALRRARIGARMVLTDLQGAAVARAVMSRRQLQEVMVNFWENHFNIYALKGPERYLLGSFDRDAIRPHALGKFRDLLGAVAHSPAMLFYLDNWESGAAPAGTRASASRGRSPAIGRRGARIPMRGLNENYGRELLELHTLGVDGGYTQADVIAAARALTGWSIDRPRLGGGFVFRPRMHDTGAKIFLGHTLPAGRGIADGEEVLDIVARSPATAHHIAFELARRFVSDSPPPALVDRAAATFLRTGGDIRETLRTIVTSPEFFSAAAYRAKVKSPFELVVSALRAVDARPDSTPRTAAIIARLGEPVFGHQAPDGYPETGDAWMNAGAILERINFGLALGRGVLPGVSLPRFARVEGLDTLPPAMRVDGVVRAILGGEASPDTRRILESGTNPLLGDASPAGAPRPRTLITALSLALGAPEFQRR